MTRTKPHATRAFTVVELLVALAIGGMLGSLLLPAIQGARGSARRSQCGSRIHNIGTAYEQYIGRFPSKGVAAGGWDVTLLPFMEDNRTMLACPEGAALGGVNSLTVRVTHGGWPEQLIPCEPGPRCQKNNVTANSYELWFEDWNNWDYRDLRLKIDNLTDGTSKVTVILLDSSSTFDLLGDGAALLSGLSQKNWRGQTCSFRGGAASYGMNNRSAAMAGGDSGKILLLDYTKKIANVVGADATDAFSITVAPRHGGVCNVLFVDGHITPNDPGSIDPQDLAIHDRLWKPSRDLPLSPAK
jgi:prepilin-type processing-associated H-X9-DG protein